MTIQVTTIRWADVGHWSQRGAYLGYQYLMQILNENNGNKFRVLDESDYTIGMADLGETISRGIHEEKITEMCQ